MLTARVNATSPAESLIGKLRLATLIAGFSCVSYFTPLPFPEPLLFSALFNVAAYIGLKSKEIAARFNDQPEGKRYSWGSASIGAMAGITVGTILLRIPWSKVPQTIEPAIFTLGMYYLIGKLTCAFTGCCKGSFDSNIWRPIAFVDLPLLEALLTAGLLTLCACYHSNAPQVIVLLGFGMCLIRSFSRMARSSKIHVRNVIHFDCLPSGIAYIFLMIR